MCVSVHFAAVNAGNSPAVGLIEEILISYSIVSCLGVVQFQNLTSTG